MKELGDIQIQRTRAIHHQITDQLRTMILSGKWEDGRRLPTARELANLWGTDVATVHRAMTPLVTQGLIERTRRVGTFVRRRAEKLTCVGVLDGWVVNDSPFKMALLKALQEELRQAGIEMDLWLEPRPEEQFGEPWQPFWHAAAHREFQAVIVTGTSTPHLPWHTKLPVPTAFLTGPHLPNSVGFDFEQFAELSVEALAQQGCRSVGLILPGTPATPAGARYGFTGFYERLMDRIGELGLTIKNEWVRTPPPQPPTPRSVSGAAIQERFGHEAFLQLSAQAERPDGLIVYPDTVVRGVILGLLEQRVSVPADLKLVLHRNEAVDLYCPLPATLLVSSERKIARALIAQMQRQFRGERCEQILISFDAVSNAGS